MDIGLQGWLNNDVQLKRILMYKYNKMLDKQN